MLLQSLFSVDGPKAPGEAVPFDLSTDQARNRTCIETKMFVNSYTRVNAE